MAAQASFEEGLTESGLGRDPPDHPAAFSQLDFSHLSQSGWVAHRPSAQSEAISSSLHTPLFAISATKLPAAIRKGLLRGF
jgi:hypothetical protein